MSAPSTETFAAAAKVAAQTSLRDLIDGGSGAGKLKIRDASDVLLWTGTLADPCGTVDSGTGQLTITLPTSTVNASATGTAAYGEITDSADTVLWQAPTQAGSAPVSGKVVINTLSLVIGSPATVVSITFG